MTHPSDSRTTGAVLAFALGVCFSCTTVNEVRAELEPDALPVSGEKTGKGKTEFTPEEREKLRVALRKVLNDPDLIASRNRARSAIETYKAELREAVKRASPELGDKVEEMLVERLTKSDTDLFMIRFRSLFKPMKELPRALRGRARELFGVLSADPEMERLKKTSLKTRDVGGRSKIYGAMRARIAELIGERDPALFEALQPLPGMVPRGNDTKKPGSKETTRK